MLNFLPKSWDVIIILWLDPGAGLVPGLTTRKLLVQSPDQGPHMTGKRVGC